MELEDLSHHLEIARARVVVLHERATAAAPEQQATLDRAFTDAATALDCLEASIAATRDSLSLPLSEAEAVEHERGLLDTLMDNIPDGIYFKDATGHFLKINRGQAHNLGITSEAEAVGKTDFDFFDVDHAEASEHDEQQIMTSGQPLLDCIEHYVDNDGKAVWISTTKVPTYNAAGRATGIVGISRDITQRRATEVALMHEREFLKTLLANLSDGIVACDRDGVLTLFNDAARTFHNLPAAPIPAHQWAEHYDLYLADGHTRMLQADIPLFRALQGETVRGVEFMVVPKDGTPRTLIANGNALFDQQGQKLGAVVVMRDITGRKRAEAALRQAKEELEMRVVQATTELRHTNLQLQSELAERRQVEQALREAEQERARLLLNEQAARAEAEAAIVLRDEFISIAAHELKTPVTAMLGYTQLLASRIQRGEAMGERTLRALQVIGEQTTRLSQLITSLLDISHLQVGHFMIERRSVDVCALARRVVAEFELGLQRHTLAALIPDVAIMIMGDDLRLEQVLQNLLQNAVKYSPAGGPITLRVEAAATVVAIMVSDQGLGIPPVSAEHLFQRFYRASNIDSRRISGLGLGLYIVKEIMDRHGGTVEVQSVEGQGSTFTVQLPILEHWDNLS